MVLSRLIDKFREWFFPRESIARSPTPPPPDLLWKDQMLHVCSRGDIKTANILLEDRDEKLDPDGDDEALVSRLLGRSIASGHADVLQLLLDHFPEYPQSRYSLNYVHHQLALYNGSGSQLQVYKVLIGRFPFLQEWDYGELADHLGSAAVHGDLELVKFMIEQGADASKARFMIFPVGRTHEYDKRL